MENNIAIYLKNNLQNTVYVKENGEVLLNFIQSKKILDIYKKVCIGEKELYPALIAEFNKDANNTKDMSKLINFLERIVKI